MRPMKIGFLGAGRMATAMAKGLVDLGVCPAAAIAACDVAAEARDSFAQATGVAPGDTAGPVIASSTVLVLAVKPQQAPDLLKAHAADLDGKLLLSIAAGLSVTRLETCLGKGGRVIRVMPNTPALIGRGVSAFCLGSRATPEDGATAHEILSAIGSVHQVPEKYMDAVTGLSGSGPAYIYMAIEALADGGVAAGLPRDLALRLAASTVAGAGALVEQSGQHPGALKDAVASPGGTTIEGLRALESRGFRSALIEAVLAATQRSKELGAA